MKRIERIKTEATRQVWLIVLCLSIAVCGAAWAVVGIMHEWSLGGVAAGMVSAIALRVACWHVGERRRLRGLIERDARWRDLAVFKV